MTGWLTASPPLQIQALFHIWRTAVSTAPGSCCLASAGAPPTVHLITRLQGINTISFRNDANDDRAAAATTSLGSVLWKTNKIPENWKLQWHQHRPWLNKIQCILQKPYPWVRTLSYKRPKNNMFSISKTVSCQSECELIFFFSGLLGPQWGKPIRDWLVPY